MKKILVLDDLEFMSFIQRVAGDRCEVVWASKDEELLIVPRGNLLTIHLFKKSGPSHAEAVDNFFNFTQGKVMNSPFDPAIIGAFRFNDIGKLLLGVSLAFPELPNDFAEFLFY